VPKDRGGHAEIRASKELTVCKLALVDLLANERLLQAKASGMRAMGCINLGDEKNKDVEVAIDEIPVLGMKLVADAADESLRTIQVNSGLSSHEDPQ